MNAVAGAGYGLAAWSALHGVVGYLVFQRLGELRNREPPQTGC